MSLDLLLVLAVVAMLVVAAGLIWRAATLSTTLLSTLERARLLADDLSDTGVQGDTGGPEVGAGASPDNGAPAATFHDERRALEERCASLEQARGLLQAEVAELRGQVDQQRHRYLFLRGLLAEPELLAVLEEAASAASAGGGGMVGASDGAPAVDAGEAETEPLAGEEHAKAARMARVMVGDLFLYNRPAVEACRDEAALRSQLAANYKAALDTFDARVPRAVRDERHYLKAEFERRIRERMRKTGASSGTEPAPRRGTTDRRVQAEHVARLMVARMMLENIALVERGIGDGTLRQAIDTPYQALRREYQSLVGEPVEGDPLELALQRMIGDWDVRNTLDSELEQLFAERFS